MPHDLRDVVVDFLAYYHQLTGIGMARLLCWLGLCPRKFNRWKGRYGKANEHNAMIPRDHWIEPQEPTAIESFARDYPLEGYRRLTFMMLDHDVAAVSPATTYRVLKGAGLIGARHVAPSTKGKGFLQPLAPHDHWHVDFSYLNIGGTFYYLCSVLDGCSRAILAWDIRAQMKEPDAEIVIQRAREAFPQARPRIITDNGPQFVAKDFKEFIRLWQTTEEEEGNSGGWWAASPTSSPPRITRRATANSNAIIALSKSRPSDPKPRSLWRTPNAWSPTSSSTTTTPACTPAPATSRPPIAWQAATPPSSRPETKNSNPHENNAESNASNNTPSSLARPANKDIHAEPEHASSIPSEILFPENL